MPTSIVSEALQQVLTATDVCLMPLGFMRRRTVFRLTERGNCGIVEFQRSSKSSRDRLIFTVNIGVACGQLLDPGVELRKARVVDAHVRERIGMLLGARSDKWWEISRWTEPRGLAREVSGLVLEKAVPYVQRYLSTNSIIALWTSGKSPGLTEGQRVELLARLNDEARNHTV